MRITAIRERTVSIATPVANAVIDFSAMTISLVAVITDVVREGRAVMGYGFNSNGRYGQGALIRDRFAPRILAADEGELLNDEQTNLDPRRIWSVMFRNEKPGGHGERSVAMGTIAASLVKNDLIDQAVLLRSDKAIGADGIDPLADMPFRMLTHSVNLAMCGSEQVGPDRIEYFERP